MIQLFLKDLGKTQDHLTAFKFRIAWSSVLCDIYFIPGD